MSRRPVIVNGLPKGGTHMLQKLVRRLGYRERRRPLDRWLPVYLRPPWRLGYHHVSLSNWRNQLTHHPRGDTHLPIGVYSPIYFSQNQIEKWLRKTSDSCYIFGHNRHSDQFDQAIRDLEFKHICLLRNPLATFASWFEWTVTEARMKSGFETLTRSDRFQMLLEGGTAPIDGRYIAPFVESYQAVYRWTTSPHTHCLRFEDLVGSKGGGSDKRQQDALEQIVDYLELSPSREALDSLTESLYGGTRTFKLGRVDSWKERLTQQEVDALSKELQPLFENNVLYEEIAVQPKS